jgi:hypothetical protein
MAKARVVIPPETAARVLFAHDRTCCVCRQHAKPVQIHHIDDNPSNNDMMNLAVLCFDCHRETQIRGGFDRKLDADQVTLYRDDWLRLIARKRVEEEARREAIDATVQPRLELATSIAEIYRSNHQSQLLALHYHSIGNTELRDKCIEEALSRPASDQKICSLRGLQGRPDLIPQAVIDRELVRYDENHDWSQKARFLMTLRRYREAAVAHLRGILESLEQGNSFSAAFYLEEFAREHLTERLFEEALREAREKQDLWWQIQALKHLGWTTELKQVLQDNRSEIDSSGNLFLQIELASADGDTRRFVELRKQLARGTRTGIYQGQGKVDYDSD